MKPDALLAAVVHPQFKLGWITDDAQKSALVEMLNRRVRALISCSTADGQADGSLSIEICGAGTSDFITRISTARKQRILRTLQSEDDAGIEVDRYLADSCTELSSLNSYPNIKNLYISLNTGLPASAAVERLFSLGGRIFSPMRTRLSSEHFEMMAFLRLAK